MPIGGETIGRAYVKILADGDGFGDDVARQLDDSAGKWKASGRTVGKAFNEGRDEEMKRYEKKSQKDQLNRLRKSLGKWEALGSFAGSKYGKGLQDFLHKKFGEIGKQMFSDINQEIKSGKLDFDALDSQLDNLAPRFAAAARKISAEIDRVRKEEEAADTKARAAAAQRSRESVAQLNREINQKNAALEAARKEQEREATKVELAEQRRGKERLARAKRDLEQQEKAYAEHTRRQAAQGRLLQFAEKEIIRHRQAEWKELGDRIEAFGKLTLKSGRDQRGLRDDLQRLGRILPELTGDTQAFQNRFNELNRTLRRTGGSVDGSHRGIKGLGNTIGRMFGKGSRNDFLNFFGGFVSIGPRLIGMLAGVGGWVAGLGQQFQELSKNAGGGFGGFISALGSSVTSLAATGLPGLAAAAIAAAATLEILFFTLGPLVSGLVMTAGAVLSLAGALGFALVGGLVAVAGAMVPLAAGIGVVALAIGGLNKKTKVFKDLSKEWKSLQKVASKAIFGDKQQGLAVLQNILEAIKPLIKDVGEAVGDLMVDLGKATGTKAFRDGIKDISDVITPMIPLLGSIIKNIGTFLGRAFVAAAPMAKEFLGWLDKVTKAMADFGKPGKGGKKSPLATLFEDGWESAKKVGKLIGNVGKILGTVFSAGKGAGDSMIDKMATAAEDLNKWLTSAEGQKALKTLFEDAELLFDKLGELGGAALDLIDALDTPTNRVIFFQLLGIATDVIKFLSDAFYWLDKANAAVAEVDAKQIEALGEAWKDAGDKANDVSSGKAWGVMKGHLKEITDGTMWDSLKEKMSQIGNGEAFEPLREMGDELQRIFAPLGAFFSELGTQIGTWISTGVEDALDSLQQRAGEAANGISTAFHTVVDFFTGLGTDIVNGWNTAMTEIGEAVGNTVRDIGTYLSGLTFQGIADAIKQPFIDLYNFLIGNSLIPDLVNGIVGWFARLPGLIAGVLGNLSGRFVTWLAGVPQKIQNAVGLVVGAFGGLAGKAIARAGNIVGSFAKWVAGLAGKARAVVGQVVAAFGNWAGKIISKAGSLSGKFAAWVSSLAGKARSVVGSVVSAFANMAGKIISKAGSITSKFGSWVSSLPGKAKTIAGNIASAFSGLAGKIIQRAGDIASKFAAWGSKAVASAGRVASNIVSKFSGLASKIVNAIGNIVPKIKMPSIPRPVVNAIVKVVKPKNTAAGGIFASPEIRRIGEAGPEAVVPLNRALSRVDPAVRALSAFAQGINQPGTSNGPSIGRQIDVGGITINTPTTDPRAVASEVVTRLTFASYI